MSAIDFLCGVASTAINETIVLVTEDSDLAAMRDALVEYCQLFGHLRTNRWSVEIPSRAVRVLFVPFEDFEDDRRCRLRGTTVNRLIVELKPETTAGIDADQLKKILFEVLYRMDQNGEIEWFTDLKSA